MLDLGYHFVWRAKRTSDHVPCEIADNWTGVTCAMTQWNVNKIMKDAWKESEPYSCAARVLSIWKVHAATITNDEIRPSSRCFSLLLNHIDSRATKQIPLFTLHPYNRASCCSNQHLWCGSTMRRIGTNDAEIITAVKTVRCSQLGLPYLFVFSSHVKFGLEFS